jgi:hypothetical protein
VFLRHKNNSLLAPRCTDAAGCAKVGVLVSRSRRREPAGSVAVRSGQREGPRIACSLRHAPADRISLPGAALLFAELLLLLEAIPCLHILPSSPTQKACLRHFNLSALPLCIYARPGSPSTHNVTPDDLRAPSILPALHLRLSTACKESAGAMASTARNNPHNELMSALSTSVSSQALHLSIS